MRQTHIDAALEKARERCPGWVMAVLLQALAGVGEDNTHEGISNTVAKSADDAWHWASTRLPVAVGSEAVGTHAAFLPAIRKHLLSCDRGVSITGADGQSLALAREQALQDASRAVPTCGPAGAMVAFVGMAPTEHDAKHGEPLSGHDGVVFAAHYLQPLGLRKDEVIITHCIPVVGDGDGADSVAYASFVKTELGAVQPGMVIALGTHAAQRLAELGKPADFVLPHPAGVRRGGDVAQVTRRLKAVSERLDVLRSAKVASLKGVVVGKKDEGAKDVHIAKALDEKQIVIGVVLDGYQVDSQGDWTPPSEIEKTAHDWMANSRVVGLQHEGPANAVVVESWLWPYPTGDDYRAAMAGEPHQAYAAKFGDQVVHSGSWLIGVKIMDDETWAAVQAGLITAYSIGGNGLQQPMTVGAMPDVTYINA